jgi:serine/threonine-protein kinase
MDTRGAKDDQLQKDPNREVSSVGSRSVRAADVEDAPRALAGKTIGRYRLLYPIAAGGMAQVWTARPEGGGLARTVAIKLVRAEYAADEEYSRMFIDEAMVASSIHHPNVCEIFELGRDHDVLFMVLEWVAGDSLSGLVQRGPEIEPLPDAAAARIVADACAGLHAAHEALGPDGQPLGIVHRDVSPPNILVSMHGHVKVSDFGIAKARHQLHSRTRTGEIKGKFAYIPPEQILGRGVDRRADVYAMGCVLYVATLGLRPFGQGASALAKIVQGKFRLPRELRSDYPEELQAIVTRALAADPNQRYQSAEEMRRALEQWLLSCPEPFVPADMARLVRERMNPERLRIVEAVMSSSRTLPEALAYQLLAMSDKADTPTATSGLVVQPSKLQKQQPPPATAATEVSDDPDATLVRNPEEVAKIVAGSADHASNESSNGSLTDRRFTPPTAHSAPPTHPPSIPAEPSNPGRASHPGRSSNPGRASNPGAASGSMSSSQRLSVSAGPASGSAGRLSPSDPTSASSRAPRNSSSPPEFRQGLVSAWFLWTLGLAIAIAILAYLISQV